MKGFFLNKQSQLKALVQKPSENISEEEAKQLPERTRINQPRKPLIDPYKDYLITRWNQGCRNAQQVHRELKEQGYTGSDQPIVRYFARFRKQKDARKFKQIDPAHETPVKVPPKRPPTASQVAHWITFQRRAAPGMATEVLGPTV